MIKRKIDVCSSTEQNPGSLSDLKSSVVYDHVVLRSDYAIQGKWLCFSTECTLSVVLLSVLKSDQLPDLHGNWI